MKKILSLMMVLMLVISSSAVFADLPPSGSTIVEPTVADGGQHQVDIKIHTSPVMIQVRVAESMVMIWNPNTQQLTAPTLWVENLSTTPLDIRIVEMDFVTDGMTAVTPNHFDDWSTLTAAQSLQYGAITTMSQITGPGDYRPIVGGFINYASDETYNMVGTIDPYQHFDIMINGYFGTAFPSSVEIDFKIVLSIGVAQ